MSDVLTNAIIKLYQSDRFYAELILNMDKKLTKSIPTAGVCIKDKVELYVNPDYFNSIPLEEQVAVLKHECAHILNDHIPRSKILAPEAYTKPVDGIDSIINSMKHRAINVAADAAINPGIPSIPKESVFPKLFDLPDGHTMEDYFGALRKQEREGKDPFGYTKFDDHSLWAESDGDYETLREKIKQHVKTAVASAGPLSHNNQLLVDRLLYKPKDWKSDLKRFASHSMNIVLESSKKKRNRRYGIQYPGTVKRELLHIGVALDTSGSINDETLGQFMAEIGNIAKYAIVTVVEADSEVKNAYVFDPKKTYTVSGRGGTAFAPALTYLTDQDVDGIIYLTDGDNYDSEDVKQPKVPVLWALIGNQEKPFPWGSETRIEIKNA